MKTTIKTQICNMTVELTNDTRNGTRYMLCIGNRRVYTSEDLTVDNDDLCWLVNRYYDGDLTTVEVLDKIIMMYNEAEATTEEVAKPEGITDALGVTYKAYPIPEEFDCEAESEEDDVTIKPLVNPLTRKLIECSYDFNNVVFNIKGTLVKVPAHKLSVNPSNLKATVKATVKSVTKVRRESLYDLSNRFFNIRGRLYKSPLMPSLDKVYDEAYYVKFEVGYRFCNWNGTPSFWNE